jgi:copper chaperone CopZ
MKNCGSTVRAALEGVTGVSKADVSLEAGGRALVHLLEPRPSVEVRARER